MMDMIEKVARAIDPDVWENWDNWVGLKGYNEAEKAEEFVRSKSLIKSLQRAEAAIEAYGEPTPAMVDSGVAFALNVSLGGNYMWSAYVTDMHRTMSAAALTQT